MLTFSFKTVVSHDINKKDAIYFGCCKSASALAIILLLSGCSDKAAQNTFDPDFTPFQVNHKNTNSEDDDELLSEEENNDPFEIVNRQIFRLNTIIDDIVLKPLATIIDETVPKPVQLGTRNVIDNAFTPLTTINYVLQGDLEQTTHSLFRFIINSTIGVLGLFDIAQDIGIQKKMTSLNKTFAKWGMEAGPYVVLPILGPSSFRDVLGKIGDYHINPVHRIITAKKHSRKHRKENQNYELAVNIVDGVLLRTEYIKVLNDMEKSYFDLYVARRNVFMQQQKVEEHNNK